MQHVSSLHSEIQRLTRRLEADPHNPTIYIQRGMVSFQLGDIAPAIADFDCAEHLNSALTPSLWQRGIACYYAGRFEEGARQFEMDLTVNGHDVEETVWRYLCQAQTQGVAAARAGLFPVRRDPRPLMEWVYQLFAGACDPEAVIAQHRDSGGRDRFYSHLYVGLYCEAARETERACYHITQAAEMQVWDDYMGWVASVHQRIRGWDKRY